MGASNPIGGTCYLKLGGAQVALKGKFVYNVQKKIKEKVVGIDSVHGHTEKPHAPYIKGSLSDLGGVSHQKILDYEGVVTAELANGKVIVLRGATHEGESEVDGDAGEYPVHFVGMDGEELTA